MQKPVTWLSLSTPTQLQQLTKPRQKANLRISHTMRIALQASIIIREEVYLETLSKFLRLIISSPNRTTNQQSSSTLRCNSPQESTFQNQADNKA